MKLGTATIDKKTYHICLNMRVLANLQDRTGNNVVQELQALEDNFNVKNFMALLHDMLVAGQKEAERLNIATQKVPELEELYDLIGIDDFGKIFSGIAEVAKDKPEFETKPKNAHPTLPQEQDG